MSYRKHLIPSDISPSELYKAVKLGTNLAEVGTDCISRQALLDKFEPWLKVKDYNDGELNMLKAVLDEIRFMRPAQPELIEKEAYIRGFEHGRTQGMIDSHGGKK